MHSFRTSTYKQWKKQIYISFNYHFNTCLYCLLLIMLGVKCNSLIVNLYQTIISRYVNANKQHISFTTINYSVFFNFWIDTSSYLFMLILPPPVCLHGQRTPGHIPPLLSHPRPWQPLSGLTVGHWSQGTSQKHDPPLLFSTMTIHKDLGEWYCLTTCISNLHKRIPIICNTYIKLFPKSCTR